MQNSFIHKIDKVGKSTFYTLLIIALNFLSFIFTIAVIVSIDITIELNYIVAEVIVSTFISISICIVIDKYISNRIDMSRQNYDYELENTVVINSSSILIIKISDFVIRHVNDKFCQVFSSAPSEYIDTSIIDSLCYGDVDHSFLKIINFDNSTSNFRKKVNVKLRNGNVAQLICDAYKVNENDVWIFAIENSRVNKIEETLKNSLYEFNSLFNSSSVSFIVLDKESMISRVNKTCINVLGYNQNDLIGESPLILTRMREKLQTLLSNKYSGDTEIPLIHKSGYEIWCYVSCKMVVLNKNLNGAILSFQDISDKHKIEKELKQSYNKYKNLFENTGNTTFTAGIDKVIKTCNLETESLLGYNREEIQNKKSWDDFIVDQDKERIEEEYNRFLGSTDSFRDFEFKIYDKSENVKSVLLKMSNNFIDNNITVSMVDISYLKASKENIRKSINNLERSQEIGNIGYWTHNIKNGEIYWSDKMYEIFAVPKSYVPGEKTNASNFDGYDKYLETVEQAMKNKSDGTFIHSTLDGKGKPLYIKDYFHFLYDENGEPYQSIGVTQNITKFAKTREEMRKEKERLELIIEGAEIGIWVWRVNEDVFIVSNMYNKIIEFERDDNRIGLNEMMSLIYDGDTSDYIKEMNRHLYSEKDYYEAEIRMNTSSGGLKWVYEKGMTIETDSSGQPTIVAGITTDHSQTMEERFIRELTIEISSEFIEDSWGQIDSVLYKTITQIGNYTNTDYSYIHFFDNYSSEVSDFYTWKSSSFDLTNDWLADYKRLNYPSLYKRLKNNEIVVNSFEEYFHEEILDDRILKYGIKSQLILPLNYKGKLVGFIGFDSIHTDKKWSNISISLIKIIGDLIVNGVFKYHDRINLFRNKERFRSLVEISDNITISLSAKGEIEFASQSVLKLGYDADEILGKKFAYIFKGNDKLLVDRIIKDVCRNKVESDDYEFRYILNDGRVKWIKVKISPINIVGSRLAKAVVLIEDITEYKSSELQLYMSHQNLSEIQKIAKLGSWKYNFQKREMYLSKHMYSILKIDKSRKITSGFIKRVCDQENLYANISYINSQVKKKKNGSFVQKCTVKNRIFYLKLYFEPIFYGTKLKKLSGLLQDVTTEAHTDVEISTAFNMYKTIFETSGSAMVLYEYSGTILNCNKLFTELLGYTKEEVENKSDWKDYVHSDDLEMVTKLNNTRKRSYNTTLNDYECRLISKSGQVKHVRCVVERIPGTDNLVTSFYDLTDIKLIEDDLKISEERFKIFADNSESLIVVLDENLRITRFNHKFCSLIGLSGADIYEQQLSDYLDAGGYRLLKSKIDNNIEVPYKTIIKTSVEVNVEVVVRNAFISKKTAYVLFVKLL